MRKISRMWIALMAGGLMVASTQADMSIISNPHGLDLNGLTGWGIDGWDWSSDTLGTAYDNGQVDVTEPSPVVYGDAANLVDGAFAGGLIMYNAFTAGYTLNASYDGPRTLGTVDGQYGHALRIGMDANASYQNYHLITYYQTTDNPGVWNTLFEVQDLDNQTAGQTIIYVNTDAASQSINNISAFAVKSFSILQDGGGTYGAFLDEFDVQMIPEPASMVLIGLGGLGFALIRRFRV